jgi:hypothetical protein
MASRRSLTPRAVTRRVAQLTALHYQLRIELKHIEPLIWRRLLVPENVTLAKLHVILQWAMGWTNSHLHEFQIGRQRYGIPDEEWPSSEPIIDERRARLNALVDGGTKRFAYVYDFGDHWEHTVKVEDLVPPRPGAAPVLCIAGENACPPEDVGGPPGYFEFLAALKDPAHEQHTELLEWIGGPFDPAAFDITDANERLANIKR